MAKRDRKRYRRHARRPHGARLGNYPSGKIEITRAGYGFVDTEEGSFYIPATRTGGALPGDIVEVRPNPPHEGSSSRRSASVSRVLHRATDFVVGVLELSDPLAVVVPQDPRIQHDLFVTLEGAPEVHDGDVVLAKITTFPSRHASMEGYIVEALGRADAPGMDVDIVIHNAGLSTEFSPQALEQARGLSADIEGALQEPDRRDLRTRTVFTIDPVDAKDFDDAISLDHVEGLTRLGVHIADVSSYVEWGSSIDICARDRSTSVYLSDRVLPMLPEKLSNDICSLRPGEERRTMTCDMFLDERARVVRYEIFPSVICSSRRYNYDEVQEILEGRQDDANKGKLCEFHELAVKLAALRYARGGLDFDSVEAKPVLDEMGHPIRIDLRVKTDATSMIEEAMILANETVATHVFKQKLPLVYRVHDAPRASSLEALLPVLKELGYPIEGLGGGAPAAFQRVLEAAAGRADETLVNYVVLRSMERARYSVEPLAHFGLASEHYCHFTSPIRRYPDLMVHRLLKDPRAMEGQLEWLARHASKMERVAEEAERDSVILKMCEYLQGHVGEVFEGTISNVFARGFYVRLENTLEGIVRFDALHDEYHQFDPKLQTLMGEETGRTYRLGQQVRVRVRAVDPREQRVDFELV